MNLESFKAWLQSKEEEQARSTNVQLGESKDQCLLANTGIHRINIQFHEAAQNVFGLSQTVTFHISVEKS